MKKNIGSYLGITFLVSWVCWLIVAYLTHFTGVALFSPIALPLYSLGAAGPMIGACIVKKRTVSKRSFSEFIKNIFNLKQPIQGYVVVAILAWSFCFIPVLLGMTQQQAPLYTALFQLPIMIFFGGGLEEVGWRGYLLPQLQNRYSSFVSTCILAMIWSIWHLPLWLVKGSGQDTSSFMGYVLLVFSFAFLLTFLWNRYESIALCILLHAGFNSFTDVYPPRYDSFGLLILLFILCFAFFVLTEYFSKKDAMKKRIES
ncbi:CPBP family intramembrane metalloprotease [Enterococcus sp. 669A]|uniref:CPBP family intramembrane metalloprotease n=1 Tax=Candidatus Enterococcus moelleringii TaxID=2815325 RepID=A0ABS3LB35_9ENTE|nr:type II CAAX endopeptidase family protein [Enterococcus sp. 669A]MBO1306850.1 CPBP family intramembrane metalloprotease [Enterococcus sp. 669A]